MESTKISLLYGITSMILLFASVVHVGAVPTLQLYLPDAVYAQSREINGVEVTDSWLTLQDPFSLVVAGATQPNRVDIIKDVTLWIAIQEEDYLNNQTGTVTIKDASGSIVEPIGSVRFGTPDPLSRHGIYDAYYLEYRLPDLEAAAAGEYVYNYAYNFDPDNPGTADTGDLQFYTVSYSGFFWLHMDLSGVAWDLDKGKSWKRVSPYSHDADAPGGSSPVPEPSTFWLFILSIIPLIGKGMMAKKRIIGTKRNPA
ncbi:MAG: choice-of-anchor N protein [bacterium]